MVQNNIKKEQEIVVEINDFFRKIVENKDSKKLKDYFQFVKRMPHQAPFNQALVFIQKPTCFYYATAKQWEKNFDRHIKNNVNPLITLFPFGPVNFVYDYNDTTGDEDDFEKQLKWWEEEKINFNENIVEKTIKNIEKIGVRVILDKDKFEYIKKNSSKTFGYASKSSDGSEKKKIVLHPIYNNKELILESYGVLCHEIAHHLLGHLGEIEIIKNKKKKIIAKTRTFLDSKTEELEAELTAWIVFLMHGIEKHSVDYMAMWINDREDFKDISMTEVLKASKKIYDLGYKNIF